jgi:hypothetical protein
MDNDEDKTTAGPIVCGVLSPVLDWTAEQRAATDPQAEDDIAIFLAEALRAYVRATASKSSGYGCNRTIFDWGIRLSGDRIPKLDAARGSSNFYLDSRDDIKRGRLTYEFVGGCS